MILPVMGAVLLHAALGALLLLAVVHRPGQAIDATTEVALDVEPAAAPAQAATAAPEPTPPAPAPAEPAPTAPPEPTVPPVATQDPQPEVPPPPEATPDPPVEAPPPPIPDAVPPPDPPQQAETSPPPPAHRAPPPVAKPQSAARAQHKPTERKATRPPEPMAASKSVAELARPVGPQAAPSASTPAAAAAPATPAAVASVSRGWQSALAAWLQEHRTYPQAARQDNEQGRVVVRFTVDRSGHVTAVELVTSSGSRILDGAAQAMLRGANVPPFPADMTEDRAVITVPLRYRLTP